MHSYLEGLQWYNRSGYLPEICGKMGINFQTLGVVGVVRVLDADAYNTLRGPKCQIFDCYPHFSFFQNKVGCPPYPYKKFEPKSYL